MEPSNKLFESDCQDQTVILTPTIDLSEFAYESLENEADEVLSFLDKPEHRNIVIDLHRADYSGSSALGLFLKLWKKVRDKGGSMVFCNVFAHELDIFELMKFDRIWPIYGSRQEVLAVISK